MYINADHAVHRTQEVTLFGISTCVCIQTCLARLDADHGANRMQKTNSTVCLAICEARVT